MFHVPGYNAVLVGTTLIRLWRVLFLSVLNCYNLAATGLDIHVWFSFAVQDTRAANQYHYFGLTDGHEAGPPQVMYTLQRVNYESAESEEAVDSPCILVSM